MILFAKPQSSYSHYIIYRLFYDSFDQYLA